MDYIYKRGTKQKGIFNCINGVGGTVIKPIGLEGMR